MNKGIRIQKWSIGFGVVNSLLSGIEGIVIVYFAAMLVIDDAMTVGMLYAFMAYKGRFSAAAHSLIGQVISVKMLDIHLLSSSSRQVEGDNHDDEQAVLKSYKMAAISCLFLTLGRSSQSGMIVVNHKILSLDTFLSICGQEAEEDNQEGDASTTGHQRSGTIISPEDLISCLKLIQLSLEAS